MFGNRALYCAYSVELNLFVPATICLKSRLRRLFYDNNYPNWFFDKIYNKFKAKLDDIPVDKISVVNNVELYSIFVPCVGEASIRFVKALSRLCSKHFDVRLLPLYRTNKVGQHFQLKSETPLLLC